jgi:hypothetical protein
MNSVAVGKKKDRGVANVNRFDRLKAGFQRFRYQRDCVQPARDHGTLIS